MLVKLLSSLSSSSPNKYYFMVPRINLELFWPTNKYIIKIILIIVKNLQL